MSFEGFVSAGLQLGLGAIPNKIVRGIYTIKKPDGTFLPDIIPDVTIEEKHHTRMEVTDHPVEQGDLVSDHAFMHPVEITVHLGWSNSPNKTGLVNQLISVAALNPVAGQLMNAANLASGVSSMLSGSGSGQMMDVYDQLLALQEQRATFDLFTGLRTYENTVCKSIEVHTDFKTANSLMVTMICQQLIVVKTQTVAVAKDKASNPAANASSVANGVKRLSPAVTAVTR